MRELTLNHVRDDLHVAMPMGGKSLPWGDDVFVDDNQIAKSAVARIVIPIEGEGVTAIEPRGLADTALVGPSDRHHQLAPFVDCGVGSVYIFLSTIIVKRYVSLPARRC